MVINAFYTGNPTKSVSKHRYLKDVSIRSRNVLFLRHLGSPVTAEYDVPYTANSIMELLGLKSKETLRKNYINPAIELGIVKMTLPVSYMAVLSSHVTILATYAWAYC